jgi:parallel beta-helix repeat protein
MMGGRGESPMVLESEDCRGLTAGGNGFWKGDTRSRSTRTHGRRVAPIVAAVLGIVMLTSVVLGFLASNNGAPAGQTERKASGLYLAHAPIIINGDAQFTTANGVTGGTGSVSNPYLIEGWSISASPSAGVVVGNTSLHFVLRHLNIQGGPDSVGVFLLNVTNGAVERCSITANMVGIGVIACTGALVQNNALDNDELGIAVMGSNATLVLNNAVQGSYIGVNLAETNGSLISGNSISKSSWVGLNFDYWSTNETASNNFLEGNYGGLYMYEAEGCTVNNNRIAESWANGVNIGGCNNITLFSNTIEWSLMSFGAYVDTSENITLYHNNFVSNSESPQAYDDSALNHWDLGYPSGGNFWSDNAGVDLNSGPGQSSPGSDGIGDTPYDLAPPGMAYDGYPLMAPFVNDTLPVGVFTVDPAGGTTSTDFVFNANHSWDPDGNSSDLQFRWDFDGDGAWDTDWSTWTLANHTYSSAGEYTVKMEVKDLAGHVANTTWLVEVDPLVIPEFGSLVGPTLSIVALVVIMRGIRRNN